MLDIEDNNLIVLAQEIMPKYVSYVLLNLRRFLYKPISGDDFLFLISQETQEGEEDKSTAEDSTESQHNVKRKLDVCTNEGLLVFLS